MTYLMNSWYCAGFSDELGEEPIGRTLLDKRRVLYRDSQGVAVMLDATCPHRFAPMERGKVIGDTLMCPYHGLQFDRTGVCVHNPHGEGMIPPNARVGYYPVVEKDGVLWFWPGDPALADETAILDLGWMTSPTYSSFTGYLKARANYQLVIDNLLDLTHAPFLHKGTLDGEEGTLDKTRVEQGTNDDGSVFAYYLVDGIEKQGALGLALWGDRPSDSRAEMTWHKPASLDFHIFHCPPGYTDKWVDSLHVPSAHLLTPETRMTTHYFYATGRNMQIENDAITEMGKFIVRQAFEAEDEPIIAACQEAMGDETDLFAMRPAILKTDFAAVQSRRMLTKMIREEAQARETMTEAAE